MLKHCLLLCILVRTIFYFICKLILIQIITTFLWKKLSFDSLVSIFFFSFFFFVIISIILNFSSYFNLVFGLIFSYTIWGSLLDSCMYILKFLWLMANEINPSIHPASHLLTQSSIHPSIHSSMNQESYENWFVGFLVIWCSKGPKFPVAFFSQFWAAIMDILITLKY